MPPLDSLSPISDSLLVGGSPCPPSMRREAQRALALRLERATEDLAACVTAALEVGCDVTARRIESVRVRAGELAGLVREDLR